MSDEDSDRVLSPEIDLQNQTTTTSSIQTPAVQDGTIASNRKQLTNNYVVVILCIKFLQEYLHNFGIGVNVLDVDKEVE